VADDRAGAGASEARSSAPAIAPSTSLSGARNHQFYAVAFEENFSLRHVATFFPDARTTSYVSYRSLPGGGGMYIYAFGAVVIHDAPPESREAELNRLRQSLPKLTTQVVREEYTVAEDPAFRIGVADGVLRVDRFTLDRAGIVALTVAQSAAMEYYERIVDELLARTAGFVERLERHGSVQLRTRPLHRFIGQAITARGEVLSVLHLLDKPDATWEDPAMDRIYDDLRAEFDLVDRYAALESKLRMTQEALELLLGVARDRQVFLLELAVVVLILIELVVSVTRLR
jgi:uncharacterized Rmd1/YagE family protein